MTHVQDISNLKRVFLETAVFKFSNSNVCILVPNNDRLKRNFTLFNVVCITQNLFFRKCGTFYWRMTHLFVTVFFFLFTQGPFY